MNSVHTCELCTKGSTESKRTLHGSSEVTFFDPGPGGWEVHEVEKQGKGLWCTEQQEARPGGPLANPWCRSLSFSVHKIGIPFTVKLKTFHPLGLRSCEGCEPLYLTVILVLVFSWAGVLLECQPFIYGKERSCFESESLFSGLPLWKSERREAMEAAIPASVRLMAVSSLPAQHFPQPGAWSSVQTTFYSGGILSGFSPQSTWSCKSQGKKEEVTSAFTPSMRGVPDSVMKGHASQVG